MNSAVALFPELGVSAYSNEDLFHQDPLLDTTKSALALLVEQSNTLLPILIVGAPLQFEGRLFNCAVVVHRGQVLGIVPKTYLPNYREFYEKRQFSAVRDERCYEVYNIQVHGLMKRLESTGIERVVIGVSGGLDSTHALIVCARTIDRLGLKRENILGYTMPGFATSNTTHQNAKRLMSALHITARELDIQPSCSQMFQDIGHPYGKGKEFYDITFENVQAGERTSHLFRLANFHDAIVVGTGDLSELALGWTTYGVGDHMSHYNVNGSVPKTLIQYLIRWVIKTNQFDAETASILQSVLDTEISPELIPAEKGEMSEPGQSSEAEIGPFELQDFNLYYITRFGFRPSKVAFLCYHAWGDKTRGMWPDLIPYPKRNEYNLNTIKKWLEIFLYRFFKISQFKRSALPNAPKVGSGGSLSPRGDWRAPSDSEAAVWVDELRRNVT